MHKVLQSSALNAPRFEYFAAVLLGNMYKLPKSMAAVFSCIALSLGLTDALGGKALQI